MPGGSFADIPRSSVHPHSICCINCLHVSEGDKYKLNGQPVEHVSLVGQLASFKYVHSLRVGVFEIYDDSGNIEAWLYDEECNMPAMEKHVYLSVFGKLKNSGGLIYVCADTIKPVKDVNQVYFHILHTIYTYVTLQISLPTSKSESTTASTLPGPAQVAPIQVMPSLPALAVASNSSVYMAPSNTPLIPTLFSPLATMVYNHILKAKHNGAGVDMQSMAKEIYATHVHCPSAHLHLATSPQPLVLTTPLQYYDGHRSLNDTEVLTLAVLVLAVMHAVQTEVTTTSSHWIPAIKSFLEHHAGPVQEKFLLIHSQIAVIVEEIEKSRKILTQPKHAGAWRFSLQQAEVFAKRLAQCVEENSLIPDTSGAWFIFHLHTSKETERLGIVQATTVLQS
ncbi:hypothetical protein C8R44DRAFT_923383 [Mycena epipterygia]|nr:hypothetical protein C8R44DRAFT_923383 [Mycena epipterygia]